MKKEKKSLLFLALVVVAALLLVSLPAQASGLPGRGRSLAEARNILEEELLPMADAGFVGITHSEADGKVIVFVEDEQAERRVPRQCEGYPVQTEVTGRIQTLATEVLEPLAEVSADRGGEIRPLVGGTSLSAYVRKGVKVYPYAGTLGMVTYDNKILSNAHIIGTNPETGEFLNIGNAVVQPGTYDGGTLDDRVGALEAYIPIAFGSGARNYADAAIASIDSGIQASPGAQFSEQGNYWIEGWTEVSRGDIVRKSGCTTGVTVGQVIHTSVSVMVWYGDRSAYFVDQIAVRQKNWSFAAPGDSGSAVDKDGQFVGLLFAGSVDVAIVSKARHIIDDLGIAVQPLAGHYSLTISSTPGGSVTQPREGMSIYNAGQVVLLVAEPEMHWHFARWTGQVGTIADVNAAQTTITMYNSYSITANFELDAGWCSLTTASSEGGSVIVPGEGISVYPVGTVVSLVAQPKVRYRFVEWTGDVGAISDPRAISTNITMYDSYSIKANFELDQGWYSLAVSSTSGGKVIAPGEGTYVYEGGRVVNLIAQPDEGYEFVKWSGDTASIADVAAPETTITMNSSYSITANFESWHPEPAALLLISSTEGGSVITPGEGTFPYPLGSQVTLVAQADGGYRFAGWSGDVDTLADINAASTTILMDSSYSIKATFRPTSSPCCTVTAAYSTPTAGQLGILREFRDEYLLTNPPGRTLSHLYYTLSPPVAQFITEYPGLRPVVRAGLAPAVAMSSVAVGTTPAQKAAIAGALVLFSVALAVWLARRPGKIPAAKS